ncbi:hypothetical protein D3C83_316140 [compost metagenome]
MRSESGDDRREEIDTGHRREVVEQHRHGGSIGDFVVVTLEDLRGHLRFEESGGPHQNRIGPKRSRT